MIKVCIFNYLIILLVIKIIYNQCKYYNIIEYLNIVGSNNLNRVNIWESVKKTHGLDVASQTMPKTYVLSHELNDLLNDSNSQFILKTMRGKNGFIGQRTGVELYDNKKLIKRDYKQYVIGQVFIKNPFLINGHKFDIRFFLVIHCGIGNLLYLPGYCVYSNKKFKYEGLDRKSKINQVHTDESHYDINKLPRSFANMCELLSPNEHKLVIKRLIRNLKIIVESVDSMCSSKNNNTNNYHIYGIDVELTDTLEPLIIEINKTPSLSFDIKWKHDLISPMKQNIKNKKYSSSNWAKL